MATHKSKRSRKTPSQERSKATVEAILEAAAQVFVARGYAAGTTNHIAERAGVSIGSLYQYFPDKEAIALVLVERHIEEARELLTRLLGEASAGPQDLPGVLAAMVAATVELHSRNPELQHVLLDEVPHTHEIREAIRREKSSAIRTVEALLAAQPGLRVTDLRVAAYLIVNTVESLTHEFVAGSPAGLSRRRFTANLVDMLSAYLGSG